MDAKNSMLYFLYNNTSFSFFIVIVVVVVLVQPALAHNN